MSHIQGYYTIVERLKGRHGASGGLGGALPSIAEIVAQARAQISPEQPPRGLTLQSLSPAEPGRSVMEL